MKDIDINVLGSNWKIRFGDEDKYKALEGNDGCAIPSSRTILINLKSCGEEIKKGTNECVIAERALRHEIIHAFLMESGLDNSSLNAYSWAVNEEMVDWFALQWDKINDQIVHAVNQYKYFKGLGYKSENYDPFSEKVEKEK